MLAYHFMQAVLALVRMSWQNATTLYQANSNQFKLFCAVCQRRLLQVYATIKHLNLKEIFCYCFTRCESLLYRLFKAVTYCNFTFLINLSCNTFGKDIMIIQGDFFLEPMLSLNITHCIWSTGLKSWINQTDSFFLFPNYFLALLQYFYSAKYLFFCLNFLINAWLNTPQLSIFMQWKMLLYKFIFLYFLAFYAHYYLNN